MLDLRGDRSERSQQTRLGNALHSHRDQVYERYRIVKVEAPRKHRGTTMYGLEIQKSQSEASGPSGPCRDLGDKGPDTLNPIDPIGCEEVSGPSGPCTGISIRGIENHTIFEEEEKEREKTEGGGAEKGPKVPTVPTASATHTNETTSGVGTLSAEVPTEVPTLPKVPTRPRTRPIDLADFEEGGR